MDEVKKNGNFEPIPWRSMVWPALKFALVFAGLYATSLYSFLLFHSLAEFYSIAIAVTIFVLTWNLRVFLQNGFFLFIGFGYLSVGGLDILHVLSYKGMGGFPGYDANLPTQLWIAARYLESLVLLAAILRPGQRYDERSLIIGYTLVTASILGAIFSGLFPACYVEGEGLTLFKRVSEYTICGILLAALVRLYFSNSFDTLMRRYLIATIVTTIIAETFFTFYVGVYDLSNLLGHLFKILSFYMVYKAVVETGLARPQALLFRHMEIEEEDDEEEEIFPMSRG